MMHEPIETLRFESGLRAELLCDPDAEQPFAEDDAVRIVVLHRRYSDPSRGLCGRDPDGVAQWERDNNSDWFIIPLFLYDHSVTVYRVGESNPFHCPWDSGRVGIVALKRSEWGSGQAEDSELAAFAQSVAESYTAWANGECYGYILRDASGKGTAFLLGLHRPRRRDRRGGRGGACPFERDPFEMSLLALLLESQR